MAEVFSPRRKVKSNFGFTLAEVLITLGIIGVVAAITMPALINKINDTVYENQRKVAESKLSQAISMLYSKGILDEVNSTEEFVNSLRTELKISKICNEDELSSCFVEDISPSSTSSTLLGLIIPPAYAIKVTPNTRPQSQNKISLSNLSLMLTKNNTPINNLAGVITTDGTNIIIGYEPDCLNSQLVQPENRPEGVLKMAATNIAGLNSAEQPKSRYNDKRACVGALIDANGFKKPNTIEKDILFFQTSLNSLRETDFADDMEEIKNLE